MSAYDEVGPASVVVGHPKTDVPVYAWGGTLRRAGGRFQMGIYDIDFAFRVLHHSTARL